MSDYSSRMDLLACGRDMADAAKGEAMEVHTLPTGIFLKSLLSAAESCEYLGVVVLLARSRDAGAQHRELINDWTSVHDVTGPALAVLCPVPPDASPRGVRDPRHPKEGAGVDG